MNESLPQWRRAIVTPYIRGKMSDYKWSISETLNSLGIFTNIWNPPALHWLHIRFGNAHAVVMLSSAFWIFYFAVDFALFLFSSALKIKFIGKEHIYVKERLNWLNRSHGVISSFIILNERKEYCFISTTKGNAVDYRRAESSNISRIP